MRKRLGLEMLWWGGRGRGRGRGDGGIGLCLVRCPGRGMGATAVWQRSTLELREEMGGPRIFAGGGVEHPGCSA